MPVFTQSGQERRALRSRAQALHPVAHVGQAGIDPVLPNIEAAFTHSDLLKVHFDRHKEEKKALAATLAEKTGSELIQIIGHNAILYRPR
jgi:RNA-binding protein